MTDQQQQPTAGFQIVDQQIRLTLRECRAWTQLGEDGAIGRNRVRCRGNDLARVEADLIKR